MSDNEKNEGKTEAHIERIHHDIKEIKEHIKEIMDNDCTKREKIKET
jgi:hypothetical protein